MNNFLPTRRLIPKWKKAGFTINQPDMLGVIKPASSLPSWDGDHQQLELSLRTWKTTGSIGDLADALSFAVDKTVKSLLVPAARSALENPLVTAPMRLVAREILQEGVSAAEIWTSSSCQSEVGRLRSLLRDTPNDVIALVDIGQHHLANGKKRSAYRALAAAYQLSPNSVYVIRAFSRFWVHIGDPEAAHAFIKSTAKVHSDPWVMAAEIAIAQVAKRPSTQLRKAQRAITTGIYRPVDVSELAGALGGAELNSGNYKAARKLFKIALDHPNDNVIAQAITNQKHIGIEIDEQVIKKSHHTAFEGRALNSILSGDFKNAAEQTAGWSAEESFSSRPRLLQSYVLGALGDYEKALEAATLGLITDANDSSLRGNRAYALAGLERLAEADAELRILEAKDYPESKASVSATRGMILMLQGFGQQGITCYESAISDLEKNKQEEQLTDCLAFMARTAAKVNLPERDEILSRAHERYAKRPSPGSSVILKSMKETVAEIVAPELRKVVQWEWDPEKNILTEKRELTRKGAPGLIITETRKKSL